MSSSTPFRNDGVSVSYQFVVVAVVACGVFAAGVVTVMVRRRRQAAYFASLGMDAHGHNGGIGSTRLMISDEGVIVEVPVRPRRTRRKKLGPEPTVWDACVGGNDDEEEEDIDADGESESHSDSEDDLAEKKGKGRARVDWDYDQLRPVSVVLPRRQNREDPAYDPFADPDPFVDMTVLIAMPDQATLVPVDDGRLPHLQPRPDLDEGELPSLQLATARTPVAADWAELEALRPPKAPKPPAERTRRQPERVRVDGFTRALFRRQ